MSRFNVEFFQTVEQVRLSNHSAINLVALNTFDVDVGSNDGLLCVESASGVICPVVRGSGATQHQVMLLVTVKAIEVSDRPLPSILLHPSTSPINLCIISIL